MYYDVAKLKQDIEKLLYIDDKIGKLKEIVPEFTRSESGY